MKAHPFRVAPRIGPCHHRGLGDRAHEQTRPMPVEDRPTVQLKRPGYQPGKAELETNKEIDEKPERLAEGALGVVKLEYADKDADA